MENINLKEINTYWHQNPRAKNETVIEGLEQSMRRSGFFSHEPLRVFKFQDDPQYHLADGHHRYEAALKAGLNVVPAMITEGTLEEHFETLQVANLCYDVSRGDIAQPFTPSEKRKAVKALLLLPKYWERTNVWLAESFHTSHVTIKNWRDDQGFKILNPDNPLGLADTQQKALHELILKAERLAKDGSLQPVPNCQLQAELMDMTAIQNKLTENEEVQEDAQVVEEKTEQVQLDNDALYKAAADEYEPVFEVDFDKGVLEVIDAYKKLPRGTDFLEWAFLISDRMVGTLIHSPYCNDLDYEDSHTWAVKVVEEAYFQLYREGIELHDLYSRVQKRLEAENE